MRSSLILNTQRVAPFVGAWIEIIEITTFEDACVVAPFVGAWIEIEKATSDDCVVLCRSLRGSVD